MPKRMIICFAVEVTFSRSFAAPVVISWKTSSSAARPPERHREAVHQRGSCLEEAVLPRQRDRVPQRLPTTNHTDLVHRITIRQIMTHQRMTHLVIRRHLPLMLRQQPRPLLRTSNHPHDPLLQLHHLNRLLPTPRRQQRRLIHQIRQISTRKPRRPSSQRIQINLHRNRLPPRMHLQNTPPTTPIRTINHNLTIKPTRPQQRRIQNIRTIRSRNQNNIILQLKPIHLHQQLIQRLLTLIMPPTQTSPTMPPNRINLIHKHNTRRRLLRLLKQIPNTRRTHTHKHLHKIRTRNRKKRNPSLTSHSPRQQRLPRPRRPIQQHTLRNPSPQRLKLLRILQKLLNLMQLLNRLIRPSHIPKRHLRRIRRHPLRTRLPKTHHLRTTTLASAGMKMKSAKKRTNGSR